MAIRYACDKCGLRMKANDGGRFIVKMELFAAAGPVDLDAVESSDPRQGVREIIASLAQADPDEIEDRNYRSFRFDLCDECRRLLLANPLGMGGSRSSS